MSLGQLTRAALESLSEGGCFEDKQLETLVKLKQEFPEEFLRVDPQIVDIMAAVFEFNGHHNHLARLREVVSDTEIFAKAVEKGIVRGAYVRDNPEQFTSNYPEKKTSDLAQRPHDRALSLI